MSSSTTTTAHSPSPALSDSEPGPSCKRARTDMSPGEAQALHDTYNKALDGLVQQFQNSALVDGLVMVHEIHNQALTLHEGVKVAHEDVKRVCQRHFRPNTKPLTKMSSGNLVRHQYHQLKGPSITDAGLVRQPVSKYTRWTATVKVEGQFLEIQYNDTIHDLLTPINPNSFSEKKHEIQHNPKTGSTPVTDVAVVPLTSASQVKTLFLLLSSHEEA
ncbi:hypothetical protein M378DRAFT_17692 [Amanita muscaria Koide BX008]|uniref:Uncharacterized protein n=1 Tax=Amanita muscaria (strain Koide BX008) TaxID=946122 RepID=A0A0C2RZB1_AMAMK|nr:hypothetical protein M378DRAFT_17692 [Amanita muscaria Koide BX008]